MRRDPLASVLRLRQSALDEARAALEAAYAAERDATRRVQDAIETLEREMAAASSIEAGDDAVEIFARWLPRGRRDIAEAHRLHREATTALDQLRAVLALARAGVRSVETLIDQQREAADRAVRRHEQLAMDEIGSRRP